MKRKWTRCSRCALSAEFPRIEFDDEGVCSFCRNHVFYAIDDDAIEKARKKIAKLFSDRRRDRNYDALVCLSGGKDSTYTLMLAVKKYGLKPLAFTLDNGFLSEQALDNIRCAVDRFDVDHIMIRPSIETMKPIFRVSALKKIYTPRTLTRISAVCNTCITMVNTLSVMLALEKNISFVVAGFSLGQIPSNAIIYRPDYHLIQESRAQYVEAIEKSSGKSLKEYFLIRDELLNLPSPWHINLLCLESVTEDQIMRELSSIGWKKPEDVDGCSSNCRLNTFNNYVHEMAYGYNPYELELSHLIKKGFLTREEALKKLQDKASSNLDVILKELGISQSELKEATDMLAGKATELKRKKRDGRE